MSEVHESVPHFRFWNDFVRAVVLKKRGKSLFQPEITPPLDRDQVSEPLMSNFVGYDCQNALPL